jgi:hypothetical protein
MVTKRIPNPQASVRFVHLPLAGGRWFESSPPYPLSGVNRR